MDFGIKVSEPGYDVFTAEDKNLSLKTDFTLFKVAFQGTLTLSSTWNEVSHNLGYVPQFLVYVSDTTPNPDAVYFATADLGVAVARADTTKLYIKKQNANQGSAYYYIFYEPADTGSAPAYTPTSDYGIKVSRDGFDAKSANILQQVFNSQLNSPKIALDGNTSSTASGTRTVTVAHGQPVVPGYLGYFEVDNSGSWYPMFSTEDVSGKDGRISMWTDTTNLNIEITTTSSGTVKVQYYIFADQGI